MKERHNLSFSESKVLRMLMDNSRATNEEIAKETGLSRNTVSRIISNLVSRRIIDKFTVDLNPLERDIFVIATLYDIKAVPEEHIIEAFEMSDGTYLVILDQESLHEKFAFEDLRISHRRMRGFSRESEIKLYCDYCKKEINGTPYKIEMKKRIYLTCCPTCKREMTSLLKNEER